MTQDQAARRARLRTLFDDVGLGQSKLKKILGELAIQGLVPQYNYWPVSDPSPVADFQPTHFPDGGNLKNTGIGGLLA